MDTVAVMKLLVSTLRASDVDELSAVFRYQGKTYSLSLEEVKECL